MKHKLSISEGSENAGSCPGPENTGNDKTKVKLSNTNDDIRSNKIEDTGRSEEHTSELQSHSFISYAVFCLKKKKK